MVPTADEAETYSKFEFQTDQSFFTENCSGKVFSKNFLPMNSKFVFQRFGFQTTSTEECVKIA